MLLNFVLDASVSRSVVFARTGEGHFWRREVHETLGLASVHRCGVRWVPGEGANLKVALVLVNSQKLISNWLWSLPGNVLMGDVLRLVMINTDLLVDRAWLCALKYLHKPWFLGVGKSYCTAERAWIRSSKSALIWIFVNVGTFSLLLM